MPTIRVLSPAAVMVCGQTAPLRLLAELAGKAVGFLDNATNPNFAPLARHMDALLRERHAIGSAVPRREAERCHASAARAARRPGGAVDLVVTGAAD